MNTVSQSKSRSNFWGLAIAILWGISYLIGRGALDKELQLQPTWLRVAAALLPVGPAALFLWAIISHVRSLDEMQRRIHLEALVIAYPLTILLLMTLGLMELATGLPKEDLSYRHVWVALPIFYFLGLALSWRRYK
jgi:drug/metabolite transporter (DMT)-like permease